MSWSREQVQILLNEYKKHPCLYMVKTKEYANKHKRGLAMDKIADAVRLLKPDVTVQDIKIKFNGLKSTFMAEYRKWRESKISSTNEDDVYLPTLWYYNDIHFILDHCDSRDPRDSSLTVTEQQNLETSGNMPENSDLDFIKMEPYFHEGSDVSGAISQPESEGSTSSGPSRLNRSTGQNIYSTPHVKEWQGKRKRDCETDNILQETGETLKKVSPRIGSAQNATNSDDIALSQFIISKLNRITDPDIRLDTEEEIVRLLYAAIKKCRKSK